MSEPGGQGAVSNDVAKDSAKNIAKDVTENVAENAAYRKEKIKNEGKQMMYKCFNKNLHL